MNTLALAWIIFQLYFAIVQCQPATQTRTVSGAVDMTLMSGATGEEVVEACIRKIENLEVFSSDFGILKRIAYVETEFGTNYDSKDRIRGIWQILPFMRKIISQSNSIPPILHSFGINDSDILGDTADYRIPFHSALTARVYIAAIVRSRAVPGLLPRQAKWWATLYHRGGSKDYFKSKVTNHEASHACANEKMDLWFLIDASHSIGISNFNTSLNFVAKLTSKFNVSLDQVRTGMSVYSDIYADISYFNQHASNMEFERAVKATNYIGGGTMTGAAIKSIVINGFTETNGARSRSQGIPRVLIILTDGLSSDEVQTSVQDARKAGITVFAIGVGSGIEFEEIRLIASDPDTTYAYAMTDFNSLLPILQHVLVYQACIASAPLSNDTAVSVDIAPGNSHFSSVNYPKTGSVEVEITARNKSGEVYIGTLPNPGEALHSANFPLNANTKVTIVANGNGSLLIDGISVSKVDSFNEDFLQLYITLQSKENSSLSAALKIIVKNTSFTLPMTTLSSMSPSRLLINTSFITSAATAPPTLLPLTMDSTSTTIFLSPTNNLTTVLEISHAKLKQTSLTSINRLNKNLEQTFPTSIKRLKENLGHLSSTLDGRSIPIATEIYETMDKIPVGATESLNTLPMLTSEKYLPVTLNAILFTAISASDFTASVTCHKKYQNSSLVPIWWKWLSIILAICLLLIIIIIIYVGLKVGKKSR